MHPPFYVAIQANLKRTFVRAFLVASARRSAAGAGWEQGLEDGVHTTRTFPSGRLRALKVRNARTRHGPVTYSLAALQGYGASATHSSAPPTLCWWRRTPPAVVVRCRSSIARTFSASAWSGPFRFTSAPLGPPNSTAACLHCARGPWHREPALQLVKVSWSRTFALAPPSATGPGTRPSHGRHRSRGLSARSTDEDMLLHWIEVKCARRPLPFQAIRCVRSVLRRDFHPHD